MDLRPIRIKAELRKLRERLVTPRNLLAMIGYPIFILVALNTATFGEMFAEPESIGTGISPGSTAEKSKFTETVLYQEARDAARTKAVSPANQVNRLADKAVTAPAAAPANAGAVLVEAGNDSAKPAKGLLFRGKVKDSRTNLCINQASVTIGEKTVNVDELGNFSFSVPEGGKVEIGARCEGYKPSQATVVGDPDARRILYIPLSEDVRDLTGRILDADTGKPLPDARVKTGSLEAVTDLHGDFKLSGVQMKVARIACEHMGYSEYQDVFPLQELDGPLVVSLKPVKREIAGPAHIRASQPRAASKPKTNPRKKARG